MSADRPTRGINGTIPFTNDNATFAEFLQLAEEALTLFGKGDVVVDSLTFMWDEDGGWVCKVHGFG